MTSRETNIYGIFFIHFDGLISMDKSGAGVAFLPRDEEDGIKKSVHLNRELAKT